MAKINSSNQDYTNNSDGWSLSGGTVARSLAVASGDIVLTGNASGLSFTFPDTSCTLQEELVSGTNIKTINTETLLGSGDLTIEGGASVTVSTGEPADPGAGDLWFDSDDTGSALGVASQVKNEVPTGSIDGTGTDFTTTAAFTSGTLQVYKNGIRLKGGGADFTESVDADGFTMVTAPAAGTVLLVDYCQQPSTYATGSTSFIYSELVNETPDATGTSFTVDNSFVGSSTCVYLDGVRMRQGTDYTESDAGAGEITFTTAPATGSEILVDYQASVSVAGNADTLDGYHASQTPTASVIPVLDASGQFVIDHIVENTSAHGVNIDGLEIKDSAITQSSWTEVLGGVGFENSWVNFGGAYNTCAYMKDSMGFVHLKGLTKSGTVTAAIFTLPSGYRPAAQEYIAVESNNAFGLVEITTVGIVKCTVGNNAHVSLDNITFKAA